MNKLTFASDKLYYMHDPHGNVIETYKPNQTTPYDKYFYNSYGTQNGFEDTDMIESSNEWGYCDQLYDGFANGNYYMRAREYNPGIGRFISEDPIRDGSNWYVYCNGNPVMFIDPSGMATILFTLDGDHQPEVDNAVASRMGDKGQEVYKTVPFKTGDEFIELWKNTTITENDDVIIHMHGTPTGLSTHNQDDYTAIDISKLDVKSANSITLISCNTGFVGIDNNVAEQFYDRMQVNFVVAADGSVYNNLNRDESDYLKVDAYASTTFENICKHENVSRDSLGFLMYYKDDNSEQFKIEKLGNGPYYPEELVKHANIFYNKIR